MKNRIREITAAMRKHGFGELMKKPLKKKSYHQKRTSTIYY